MSVQHTILTVKDWIIMNIEQKQFAPNAPIPSLYEISRTLDISQDNVEQAIRELITEQILTEKFQEGYCVKPEPAFFYPVDELRSITKMIEEVGCTAGTIIISQDPEVPSRDDKKILNITDDQLITVVERIRTADGLPVAYCLDKINQPDFDYLHLNDKLSLLQILQDNPGFKVAYATCEIEAISYEPYISNALECAPEESLLLFKQVHYNEDDRPVLFSMNYFKSNQMKFQIKREMK
ncbi:GntR family transcriptional regulator [Macrococcus equipercicus]|uniref:GntR family transcriptional regulator n=1 Tax=Macrococcus equipercicus TaxID=69967 RepID=A0A9Q9F223_9STAP|nr:GntR family transcriptional regulator [Macrococcus equipercicus]UTH14698.1 GntR family transcriptional regulator [Macrococcus equipercicus]